MQNLAENDKLKELFCGFSRIWLICYFSVEDDSSITSYYVFKQRNKMFIVEGKYIYGRKVEDALVFDVYDTDIEYTCSIDKTNCYFINQDLGRIDFNFDNGNEIFESDKITIANHNVILNFDNKTWASFAVTNEELNEKLREIC